MKYPTFIESDSGRTLKAFLRPDVMFMLESEGAGKGAGFQFRIFKTRATCRRHETTYGEISYNRFVQVVKSTVGEYLVDLTSYLPQDLMELDSNDQKLLT